MKTDKIQRLVVVSAVVHFRHEGRLFAYGPYAREIDVWADLVPELVIAAPCRAGVPPGDSVPFTRANISIVPQREAGGDCWSAKVRQVALLPVLVWEMARVLRTADALHVRCPANLGLLGVVLAPFFCRRRITKYAGTWNGYPGERLALRLQRGVLSSGWWAGRGEGLVTVYGRWPGQPAHVVSFFTAMMDAAMVAHAAAVAEARESTGPLRVLFSGRLAAEKRIDALLEAVKILVARGVALELVVLGGGSEETNLRRQAARLGIEPVVRFVGSLPFERSLAWYEWAHCLVLPSQHSEGWPKAIAEGMCYGLVCVGVKHGQVGDMLAGRGITLATGSPAEIAEALAQMAARPEQFRAMTRAASQWSRQYSLDGLGVALRELLTRQWGDCLRRRSEPQASAVAVVDANL